MDHPMIYGEPGEGLSWDEIALRLNITVDCAKWYYRTGMSKLKRYRRKELNNIGRLASGIHCSPVVETNEILD